MENDQFILIYFKSGKCHICFQLCNKYLSNVFFFFYTKETLIVYRKMNIEARHFEIVNHNTNYTNNVQ